MFGDGAKFEGQSELVATWVFTSNVHELIEWNYSTFASAYGFGDILLLTHAPNKAAISNTASDVIRTTEVRLMENATI